MDTLFHICLSAPYVLGFAPYDLIGRLVARSGRFLLKSLVGLLIPISGYQAENFPNLANQRVLVVSAQGS